MQGPKYRCGQVLDGPTRVAAAVAVGTEAVQGVGLVLVGARLAAVVVVVAVEAGPTAGPTALLHRPAGMTAMAVVPEQPSRHPARTPTKSCQRLQQARHRPGKSLYSASLKYQSHHRWQHLKGRNQADHLVLPAALPVLALVLVLAQAQRVDGRSDRRVPLLLLVLHGARLHHRQDEAVVVTVRVAIR